MRNQPSENGIYRLNSFHEGIQLALQLKKKTIAFFDLDNTVIITVGFKPNQPKIRQSGYGSDIWFSAVLNTLDKKAEDFPKIYMMFLQEYFEIQRHAHQMTTEDSVTEGLKRLQENNIPIFGLTARSNSISEVTLQRLRDLSIQFTTPCHETIVLDIPKTTDHPEDAIFKHGVIFCNGRSKKTCLDAFVKTDIGASFFEKAEAVLFMDDKPGYCTELQSYLSEKGKHPIVVHYTHVEEKLPVASNDDMADDRAHLAEELHREFHF